MIVLRKTLTVLAMLIVMASPASAFINPRAIATLVPDHNYPGYGILRIEVIGRAWRCVGRVKMDKDQAPEQTVGMECVGMATSATATIRPEGHFRHKVNYRLSNGIKGHLELIR